MFPFDLIPQPATGTSWTGLFCLTIGGRGVELLGKLEGAAKLILYVLYALTAAQFHKLAQLLERDAILRRSTVNCGHPARCSRSAAALHAHGTPLHRP